LPWVEEGCAQHAGDTTAALADARSAVRVESAADYERARSLNPKSIVFSS
jgi:hypothetical protein